MIPRTLTMAVLAISFVATARAADEIKPADFGKLHAMIRPRAGESPWAEVPWMTNLHEARQKAAAEGKPLFVWSASADPVGCT